MGLRDFTLHDVIRRNARVHGDRAAFVADGQRITHGEYARRVEQLAGGLHALGMAVGDRVAVVAQNCQAYVDLYGAAARLGLIVVPVNWRVSADEIVHAIADTTPRCVVVGTEYVPIIDVARARFPFVEFYVSLGPAVGAFGGWDNLLRHGECLLPPEVDIASGSGFVIIHTAAVAGRPRGALLSHESCLMSNMQLVAAWNLSPADLHLGALPLFHVAGLGYMLAVQLAGGCTVVLPKFNPEIALRAITAEKVSLFGEFPPMLSSLLDCTKEGEHDLSSLRHVVGIDTPETIERFEQACPSARFWTAYGQAEVSGAVTMAPFRERPGSAGKSLMLANVAVVDELGQLLPPDQTGEIVVRGPTVFRGYWNCEADNVFTFRDGWHHTGDLGRFDKDGYLWYAGRSPTKELIKPGGENVYPAEVERVLMEHAAVAAAVVFGVPDPQWGEAIKAVCVCRAGQSVSAAELIEFVAARLARFKRPKHVVFTNALPSNAQGSIDRAQVKKEFTDA